MSRSSGRSACKGGPGLRHRNAGRKEARAKVVAVVTGCREHVEFLQMSLVYLYTPVRPRSPDTSPHPQPPAPAASGCWGERRLRPPEDLSI